MAAPKGNTNSSRDNRLWANTIRRAILQSDGERLRMIAERLLDLAAEGDIQAMKEIGDRLDGKPTQSIDATVKGNLTTVLGSLGRPSERTEDDSSVA